MCVWLKKATAFCLCLLILWGNGGMAAAVEAPVSLEQTQEDSVTAPEPSTEPEDPEGEPSEPDTEPETPEEEPFEPGTEPEDPEGEPSESGTEPETPEEEPSEPDTEPEDPEEEPSEPGTDETEPPVVGGTPETGEGTETPGGEINAYTVTLEDRVIKDGETLSLTTVSSAFAGSDILEEGYYPGTLTVVLTGQVVVESGGSLSIGTLSVGGPEAEPVITGTGTIVVKAGGQLRLTCSVLSPQGEGPVIIQEEGGSVELTDTDVEEGMAQWSAPLVNNLYKSPDDLWLEVGTALTADLLPTSMQVDVQEQGNEDDREVPLSWDMSGYDGQTDGELTLTGQFLDESGQPLSSLVPLTLRVRWYTPGTLVVTKAEWMGSTVPTVELTVEELPEFADVWGEVSTDDGVTWTRWEDEERFFIVEVEQEGGWACVFQLADETSGLFRVAAEDPWADPYAYWRSEAFALSPPEDGEDSGGNRGGSTTPDTPDQEPEPEPRPEDPTLEKPQDLLPEPDLPEEETAGGKEDLTELPLTDSGQEKVPEDIPAEKENQNHPSGYRPEYLVQTQPDKSTQDQVAEQDDSLTLTEQEPDSDPQSDQVEEISAPVAAVEAPALAEVEELAVVQTPPQSLSTPLQFLLAAAGLAACVAAAVAVGVLRKRK